MNIELSIKKPKNIGNIDETNIQEILWWSSQWGVSPEKIITAIKHVGPATGKVKTDVHSKTIGKKLL